MTSRGRYLRGPIAFWALAGIALLVSHDAIFLVQYGFGEAVTRALREAGHGYWAVASLGLAAAGLAAGATVAVRLMRLRARARRLGATAARPAGWWRRMFVAWGRLFAVVAIGFMLQESAEHLALHGHAIGLGALIGPEYPLALPMLALVSLAAAVVAAFVTAVEVALEATLAAAAARQPRPPRRLMRPPLELGSARVPILARAAAGRAPPSFLVRQV